MSDPTLRRPLACRVTPIALIGMPCGRLSIPASIVHVVPTGAADMPALAILAFYVVIGWGLLWGFFEAFDRATSKRDKRE